jgi:hypothetical protein
MYKLCIRLGVTPSLAMITELSDHDLGTLLEAVYICIFFMYCIVSSVQHLAESLYMVPSLQLVDMQMRERLVDSW